MTPSYYLQYNIDIIRFGIISYKLDAYTVLGISSGASDADIRKAYRLQARKVHPDHRPNDASAGEEFHRLKVAYELLQDPQRRQSLDAKIKAKAHAKERHAALDSKRKALVDELEENERAHKRQRATAGQTPQNEDSVLNRIKEESKRLREGRTETILQEAEIPQPSKKSETLSATARLKYPLSLFPTLHSRASITDFLEGLGIKGFDREALIVSAKSSKSNPSKPRKAVTALVQFTSLEDAAIFRAKSHLSDFQGMDVSWVEVEPQTLQSPSTSSAAPSSDVESETLLRLRQIERERLEAAIRLAETES
ncbi:DnaJ-domain-containing protein [Clavulina sp. PMI_390]|nr:DnaJ-domain-containing protein [Clavulina sp. PMI_390]